MIYLTMVARVLDGLLLVRLSTPSHLLSFSTVMMTRPSFCPYQKVASHDNTSDALDNADTMDVYKSQVRH